MSKEGEFYEVIVIKKDGTGYQFYGDQRQDQFGSKKPGDRHLVREASEDVKVDATRVRELIKKAGLL